MSGLPCKDAYQASTETQLGWYGAGRGLKLVSAGYVLFTCGALLGLFLALPAITGREFGSSRLLENPDADVSWLAGACALAVAAVPSIILLLIGQWRCLMETPVHNGGRGLIFFSTICLCTALILQAIGTSTGGLHNFLVLRFGISGLDRLNFQEAGGVLQLLSIAMGLMAVLTFGYYLRRIALYFKDRARSRAAEIQLLFICLLVGASQGWFLWRHGLPYVTELGLVLAAGWLICLLRQPFLIASIRASIQLGVRRTQPVENPVSSWLSTRVGSPSSPGWQH